MNPIIKRVLIYLALVLPVQTMQSVQAEQGTDVVYERDVRPILKAHCFHCHGEEGVKEGNLDLRLARFILAGGDSGPAVISGAATDSVLIERVSSGEMPPEDKNLSPLEIETLKAWIDQGAQTASPEPETISEQYFTEEESRFWAFQPIVKRAVPILNTERMLSSPVDYFVLEKLRAKLLEFTDQAPREVLIRRLYFDLLGLPPSVDAVERFIKDERPDAYERLVDELLASPYYGERWGRHWLDVAGYADSEGYTDADTERQWAYAYRDYVIKSFNDNMPYDQFVTEQLAGDELTTRPYDNLTPDAKRRLIATGFMRMAPDGTGSGGIDQMVARNEAIADSINIMTTSLLGLTVGCARCHNHRYDPISQEDYYRLRAVLAPALDWQSWRPPSQRQISLYSQQDRDIKAAIEQRAQDATDARQKIVDQHIERTLSEELIKAPDDLKDPLRTAYRTPSAERTDDQVALLKEHPYIQNISAGSLYLYSRQRSRRATDIEAIADKLESEAIADTQEEYLEGIDEPLRGELKTLLDIPENERSDEQKTRLSEHEALLVTAETLKKFQPEITERVASYRQAAKVCRETDARKELDELQNGISAIRDEIPREYFIRALTEPENHQPVTYLFKRGNHSSPSDEPIAPGEMEILQSKVSVEIPANNPDLSTSGRRLAYARHLTNDRHPLVARVMVNRIWYHHFGRAFVNSLGDFGQLGERPTHPKLLDWLSREFIESGWDIKHIHRLILTSYTYQQRSDRSAYLDQIDPDNRFYARQSVRRLESEIVRDAVIAVSGQSNNAMFGEAVPVMEDGVGQIVLGKENLDGERKPIKGDGLGALENRRSVYIQVRRSRPLAVLETFDVPSVAPNCTQRADSNVAPQALLLMNSDFIVKYSQLFAKHIQQAGGESLESQIAYAWKRAYGQEIATDVLKGFLDFQVMQKQELLQADSKLTSEAAEETVLAMVCQALLASNQFIYVD